MRKTVSMDSMLRLVVVMTNNIKEMLKSQIISDISTSFDHNNEILVEQLLYSILLNK